MVARPPVGFGVRRARLAELPSVYRLFRASLPNVSSEACRHSLTRERGVYVLDYGEAGLVGFYVATLKDGSSTLWVEYLGVHPSHQRQGLGRVLMEHCERLGQELALVRVGLRPRDHDARAFYERMGYVAGPSDEDGHPRLYKPFPRAGNPACNPRRVLGRYRRTYPSEAFSLALRFALLSLATGL